MAICPKCHSLEDIKITTRPRENPHDLKESLIAQYKNELRRKMVSNDHLEIIFWYDEGDTVVGFQYSFQHEGEDVSLTWNQDKASRFHQVGTVRRQFSTNTLLKNGHFPKDHARALFLQSANNLEERYKTIVLDAMDAHVDY